MIPEGVGRGDDSGDVAGDADGAGGFAEGNTAL
jgi:hypothetical protein